MSDYRFKKVAVLGAGVMGAQIAAHLANAGVPVILFDLPADGADKNAVVGKALANLGKLSPAPLATKSVVQNIEPANYDEHLERLKSCDLIIEAIAERIDWKKSLYAKILPFVGPGAVLASNTSGLSINALSEVLDESLHHRFCGVHFFNPPRYMHLVELIPCAKTDAEVLTALEAFLVSTLGKGVVTARDTPNFIANRIGVFSILSTLHHTAQFGMGFDEVDALTGPLIGRPKSATYRTCDVVGLDTMGLTIKTMADTLPADPWHPHFTVPDFLQALIDAKALGQKTGAGIFKKVGKEIHVLDLASSQYRPSAGQVDPEVLAILKDRNPQTKFKALRASSHPQAQFLWSCFRDLFHYCAFHLADIAASARELDFAIRWGYGWNMGPLELWQAADWKQVAAWIAEDIAAGKSMSQAPLPAWVSAVDGVHGAAGSYSASESTMLPRSANPVYARQRFPDPLLGERFATGETAYEDDSVRLWHDGDGIGVLSFKSKMNTVGDGVLAGVQKAIDIAEQQFQGLVVWQTKEPFSAGADLSGVLASLQEGRIEDFRTMIGQFQATSMRIKYAQIPVVAAVRGMALGGGCEFQMHAARTVFALESYIGLVEAGVGLLPAGGGLKEIAVRVGLNPPNGDVHAGLKPYFEAVAMGKVSGSALEAKELKLAREGDVVVFNAYELLHVAKAQARAMAESAYRPPVAPKAIPVAGSIGIATFRMMLTNMHAGGFISDHDLEVSTRIATVLCGGDVDRGTLVDEQWLLDLEREHFVALAMMPKTQERIAYMLKNGKPLRN
ncbi:3-hydroxyacyl-CoA dehydrogenase/enoyl-CoA hydratase family protein [Arenimonas sp. GDDSR-1]|uniref:3-hydroxyacyl-CoA dehydrogenase/enoyl-CoA hydratase family protein n=1 Tax=Arenimonas sp. GDDSR-1 TaxID=2950125 RepID=UPI002637B42F|nr:3-hydroxyacyl-CoA dehydrogenase/enoyl-CoA hydratase family protein [Arenimonas sp. GDDSR-1]